MENLCGRGEQASLKSSGLKRPRVSGQEALETEDIDASGMAYCALADEDVPALKALEGMTSWSREDLLAITSQHEWRFFFWHVLCF